MLKRITFLFVFLLLCLSLIGDQMESENNDMRELADGPILFNGNLIGGLPGSYGGDSPFPQDYWRFSALADKTYTFKAIAENCNEIISPLDLALDIENTSGTIIATKDSFGDCDSEILYWDCPSTGTYYLVVWEATGWPEPISWYVLHCKMGMPTSWELY